jgi:hypothetical protein
MLDSNRESLTRFVQQSRRKQLISIRLRRKEGPICQADECAFIKTKNRKPSIQTLISRERKALSQWRLEEVYVKKS